MSRQHGDVRERLDTRVELQKKPTEGPLLALQRQVGNRAVGQLVAAERASASSPEIAPALDGAREREADDVADRVAARFGGGIAGGVGAVPAAVATAAGELRGRVGGVRFDLSPAARGRADAMGARAFADGPQVSFGSGELDLRSRDGVHLAAHETAHAALHAPATGSGGQRLVHARMRGTAAALGDQGRVERTGTISKVRGLLQRKLNLTTNWERIIAGVLAYETLEGKLASGRAPSAQALQAAREPMLRTLAAIQGSIEDWNRANPATTEGDVAQREKEWQVGTGHADGDKHIERDPGDPDSDTRSKPRRRQALAMLEPRVATEAAAVAAGDWSKSLGLSDSSVRAVGRQDAGQMGETTELTYETDQGPFSGYFKADAGYLPANKSAGRDVRSGIKLADPNFGARAMAMYRLDALLGAGVTARVEFATHNNQMGIVTESAKGVQANKLAWTSGASRTGAPSADDPVLQRSLNRLQILDSIALQLDRHRGNYFVETDKDGKVTKVTGIDLDMSFGGSVKDPNQQIGDARGFAWRGMPDEFDEEMGHRVLAISDDQIREALTGLLSNVEVESTVERFRIVKQSVQAASDAGMLRHDWKVNGSGAVDAQKTPDYLRERGVDNSYASSVRGPAIASDVKALMEVVKVEVPKVLRDKDLPGPTVDAYTALFYGSPKGEWYNQRGPLYHLLAVALAGRQVTLEAAEDLIPDLLSDALDLIDQDLQARIEVAIQESETGILDKTVRDEATKAVQAALGQAWTTLTS